MLTARKLVQAKPHDIEMSLRGILRDFGLKVGRTTSKTFEGRIRELVTGHPTLTDIAEALLVVGSVEKSLGPSRQEACIPLDFRPHSSKTVGIK